MTWPGTQNQIYAQIQPNKSRSHSSLRKLLFSVDGVYDRNNCFKHREKLTLWYLLPADTSTTQSSHISLRKYCRRRNTNNERGRSPGHTVSVERLFLLYRHDNCIYVIFRIQKPYEDLKTDNSIFFINMDEDSHKIPLIDK